MDEDNRAFSIIFSKYRSWSPLILVLIFAGITYGVQRSALALYGQNISDYVLFEQNTITQTDFIIFVQIASTIISYGLFKGISGFFSGTISQKYKREYTMKLGLVLLLLGTIPFAFSKYLWTLPLGNSLIGAGLGLLFTSSMAALTEIAGSRGSAFSVGTMEFSIYLGSSIGSFFAGIIAGKFSFTESFIFALIIAVIAIVLGFFFIRNVETEQIIKGSDEEILLDQTIVETRFSLAHSFFLPTIFLSYLSGHFSRITDSLLVLIFPLLLATVYNFSAIQIGLVVAVFTLSWSISMPFTGRISDTIGRRIPVVIGLFLQGIGVFLVVFTSSLSIVIILTIFAGIGTALYYPVLPSITKDAVPLAKREQSIGLFRASLDSGYVTGPLFILFIMFISSRLNFLDFIFESNSILRLPFLTIGLILIVLSLLFLLLVIETRPGWIQASVSLKHFQKVIEAFKEIDRAYTLYLEGESKEEVEKIIKNAKELEHEADNLIVNLTEIMYSKVRPAPDDYHFHKISSTLDGTIGFALRSIRKIILIPKEKIPKEYEVYLNKEWKALLKLLRRTNTALKVVCVQPMSSHPIFNEVHKIENELDEIAKEALEQLIAIDTLKNVELIFFIQIIEALEEVANRIEDTVDIMKILGLKHQIQRKKFLKPQRLKKERKKKEEKHKKL